ncbi:sulfurtransferase-like selenium metabolism protein YedF [bacterium]|nr:sulfurtransferase-like selenium metabolism protein YedF [candidate division CSSED10-310 bacterium]
MSQTIVVDVRGLACPQPVIQAKKAMMENRRVDVWVSQEDQADNVTRMAERSGWSTERSVNRDHFVIKLTPGASTSTPVVEPEDLVCSFDAPTISVNPCVVIIESDCMGRGDDVLGRLLMKAFLNTLKDCEKRPAKIVFFNSGVKMTIADSPVLDTLQQLAASGTEILVCGTCLDFFNIKDKLSVGIVSNMLDIAETMLGTGVVYLS